MYKIFSAVLLHVYLVMASTVVLRAQDSSSVIMKKRAENEVNAMKVGLSLNDNQAVLLGTVLQQFYSQMSRIHMVNNSAGARKRYMQEVYQEREKRIFEILDDAQRSSYLRHMEMRKARVVNDSATKHIRKSFITD